MIYVAWTYTERYEIDFDAKVVKTPVEIRFFQTSAEAQKFVDNLLLGEGSVTYWWGEKK